MITNTSDWTITFTKAGVPIAHDFEVLGGSLALDDRSTVYGQATLTLADVPDAIRAALRPDDLDVRAVLTTQQDSDLYGVQSRDFDLLVLSRRRNADGLLAVVLSTDEELLELRGRVDDELASLGDGANPGEGTARDVIDELLADYADGASLEAGTVDADMPRLVELTNLVDESDAEAIPTANWNAGGGSTIDRVSATPLEGSQSFRITKTGSSGNCYAEWTDDIDVEGGEVYTWSLLLRSNVNRIAQLRVTWLTGKGTTIRSATDPGWPTWGDNAKRIYSTGPLIAPQRARRALVRLTVNAAAVGEAFVFDLPTFTKIPREALTSVVRNTVLWDSGVAMIPFVGQGETLVGGWGAGPWAGSYPPDPPWPVFSGGADGEASAALHYDYEWEDTAHKSTGLRTPAVELAFDARLHYPGATALEAMKPAIDAAAGRLFCDEERKWRLVDEAYTDATHAVAIDDGDDGNMTGVEDSASVSELIDGIPTIATGVVLEYDEVHRNTGRTTRHYDVAGDATGRVYKESLGTARPPVGAAAARLANFAGRAVQIRPHALSDYLASPCQALTITLDGTTYAGTVSRVEWRWGANYGSDEMTITPRDLEEV